MVVEERLEDVVMVPVEDTDFVGLVDFSFLPFFPEISEQCSKLQIKINLYCVLE
jgi:hypothetical protein